jgi:hypothetical protein
MIDVSILDIIAVLAVCIMLILATKLFTFD